MGHPILRAIAATTATSNFFSAMVMAVVIVFLVRVVHTDPGTIGLLFTLGSIGGVVAAFVASRIARAIGGVRATILGIVCTSGTLLLPLGSPGIGLVLFAAGSFATAFGSVLYNINQVSFRQRLCPPRLLGRMNATMRFIVWGTLPLGALLGGALGSAFGVRATMWLGAIGGTLAVVWLLASPMRGLRDFPAVQDDPVDRDDRPEEV